MIYLRTFVESRGTRTYLDEREGKKVLYVFAYLYRLLACGYYAYVLAVRRREARYLVDAPFETTTLFVVFPVYGTETDR